jgi:citrate synthase
MTENKVEIRRGLRDVYIDRTKSSFIDGKIGKLLYRGYNIDDLARYSTFEETIYLLIYGSLPTSDELSEFDAKIKASRQLPEEVIQVIRLTKDAHPMDVLRTAVSALAGLDPDVTDNSREATIRKCIRLTALAPAIVAAHSRIRDGNEPVAPDPNLNHAGNFLYMLFDKQPVPEDVALLDKDFILHAEHGINASSFGARVTASTDADLHAAVTAGIAILKGPAHGGAAEEVMKMAEDIGSVENVESYIKELRAGGGRVMGFGHRVYKAVDPRSLHLKDDAKALGERRGQPKWFSILDAVAKTMEPYSKRGVCQNVDFFSGAIYYLMGIPADLFISLFAMGRIPGWAAQVMEQYDNNILLRPRLEYTGPMDLEYVPIEKRRQVTEAKA